jgi:hypothetical protein
VTDRSHHFGSLAASAVAQGPRYPNISEVLRPQRRFQGRGFFALCLWRRGSGKMADSVKTGEIPLA